MTVAKSFQFAGAEREQQPRKPVVISVKTVDGDEEFTLRDDLDGLELLEYIAASSPGPGSTRGVVSFLRRIIKPEDWDRFNAANKGAKPAEIGNMASDLIDLYSGFPTSEDATSSDGSSSTGSTQESS